VTTENALLWQASGLPQLVKTHAEEGRLVHKYVLNRLLLLIPTLLGVILIVFSIMELIPGTPARLILGAFAPEEAVDQLNEELGYNRPFVVRFGTYALSMAQGQFGSSYLSRKPVSGEIISRFPTTLKLAVLAVVISAIIGIPMGILSAVKQYSSVDIISTGMAMFLAAIPGFWLGLMLILTFSLDLGWLPTNGIGSIRHYILPTITMCLPGAASIMRMTRSTMLETIRQDYIRTARAKGASEKRVILNHALKNALLPVITSLGMRFGGMLGGTILIESVFGMPGLGTLVVNAIRQKDIPLVMGSVIFLAVLFCLIMLTVDLIYAYLDPRIKAKYTK